MPPNLETEISDEEVQISDDQITIVLTPISDYSISSSPDIHLNDELFLGSNIDVLLLEEPTQIPLEQNLRELLVQVTNTEDLVTVTQLKLRVISRETTLQYLSLYTPALRELILDGSVISSLRDLGFGLKNLKILKVNRCGITCIDGVFGLEHLEELYATDNEITTLAPCAFLNSIKVLDVRRNLVTLDDINFLKFCESIDEVYVEGNPGIYLNLSFRQTVQHRVPRIKILDGFILTSTANTLNYVNEQIHPGAAENGDNRANSNHEERNFSIEFPPRVFLQRFFHN